MQYLAMLARLKLAQPCRDLLHEQRSQLLCKVKSLPLESSETRPKTNKVNRVNKPSKNGTQVRGRFRYISTRTPPRRGSKRELSTGGMMLLRRCLNWGKDANTNKGLEPMVGFYRNLTPSFAMRPRIEKPPRSNRAKLPAGPQEPRRQSHAGFRPRAPPSSIHRTLTTHNTRHARFQGPITTRKPASHVPRDSATNQSQNP